MAELLTDTTIVSPTTATKGGTGLSDTAVGGIISSLTVLAILSFLCAWWRCKKGKSLCSLRATKRRNRSLREKRDIESDLDSRISNMSFKVDRVSIGGHSVVFMGPATGITMNQRDRESVTECMGHEALRDVPPDDVFLYKGTPDPVQVRAVADKAKDALRNVYKTTGSFVQTLPWVADNKKHIMAIYTKLRLIGHSTKAENSVQTENNINSYEDIFHMKTREGDPIKRVVISGSAGIGKTTLISKIAYDWAMGKNETLNEYELVFVLKMRSLKQTSDLMDAIFDHLLDKNSIDKSVLKVFIDKNQDKVLILLDGFDEFQTTTLSESSFGSILKVLNRRQGAEYWVVITSRPPLAKLVCSSLIEKPYTHVEVEGFSHTDIEKYVNKFFPKDQDKAKELIEQIEHSEILSDLAKCPMLLLLICLLWTTENTLPDTMTQLYNKALKYIFERKTRDVTKDEISKIMIAIGKVALDGLISTNQSLSFKEEDFEKSALDSAMNAGVLTSERVVVGVDTYQGVYFIHLTFLEYCAAMYWQSLINTEEFNRILDQIFVSDTDSTKEGSYFQHEYLIRFCCGDNEECTKRILPKVHKLGDPRPVLICYFESQSLELPSEEVINSVLTDDVHLLWWDIDSINAFIYFLNHVKGHTGENAYLAKIEKLVISNCNLHRVCEDLARLMREMTSIYYLCLNKCSLTHDGADQLLSSLANPSRLTELTFSRFDGPVSLLVPHLKKMLNLRCFILADCSLIVQEFLSIVDSLSKLPALVALDLSWNDALGSQANKWASLLNKMEHLQKINFTKCSLEGKDVEPIAMSISDMLSLVGLDLSGNTALGGSAGFWAQYLKQMKHLQKLHLKYLSLIDEDINPIAQSLSDMPNLVHLDLSGNEALGGCASSWALHLNKMRHLENLALEGCSLEGEDIEPVATTISDMPNLVYLDLSWNKALGSSESLWVPHLRQMRHLQGLNLNFCLLKVEYKERITTLMKNMPNSLEMFII